MTAPDPREAARVEAERRWPRRTIHGNLAWLDEGMASGFVLGAQWQSAQDAARIAELEEALDAIGHERNTWARQMADLRDERNSAVSAHDEMRLALGGVATERDVAQARAEAAEAEAERLRHVVDLYENGLRIAEGDLRMAQAETDAPSLAALADPTPGVQKGDAP